MKLTLSPRLFAAVAHFKAEIDMRFYLNAVHVEPHPYMPGALICATDGHQLAVAYDEAGRLDKAVSLRATKPLIQACMRHKTKILALREGRLCIGTDTGDLTEEVFVQPGPGANPEDWVPSFPNYLSMLPAGPDDLTESVATTLNATLVKRIAETAVRLGGVKYTAMQSFRSKSNPTGPIFTRYCIEPNFIALTMPMLGDNAGLMPKFAGLLASLGQRQRKERAIAKLAVTALRGRAEDIHQINRDGDPVTAFEASNA